MRWTAAAGRPPACWPAKDPCEKEQFGATERELEAVVAYQEAMKKIRRPHQNFDRQEYDKDKNDKPGDKKKGRKKRRDGQDQEEGEG